MATKNDITGDALISRTSEAYRDNYDKIFGKKKKPEPKVERNILLEALEIIVGIRQCVDNTMSDKEVAREALRIYNEQLVG